MEDFRRILDANRVWATRMLAEDSKYFARQKTGQRPQFLVISCSDSRVPITTVTQSEPGEMFMHRNIANQVFLSDLNALSVVQYAIDVLDVKHILVCGHYGCGGIRAAMAEPQHGLVDHWLGSIRALARLYRAELEALPTEEAQADRLSELNVLEQIYRLTLNPTVRDAWARGRRPILSGMVYNLSTGLLDLTVEGIDSPESAREKLAGFVPA